MARRILKESIVKAVVCLSGGLDSLLAAKVVLEQGIELEALNFVSVFCNCTPKSSCCSAAATAVRQLGIELKVVNTSRDFIEIVKHPKHGYGRNLNPCLDCRINMLKQAAIFMREIGASFIVTGEVLGERPMSQRRQAMELIERESGLAGLILRPLSAALMAPTIPEQNGWVDRAKLLGISGRSRKPQIALADEYGLHDYPCPAGGCLLTDAIFAARMRDLMKHQPDFSLHEVQLLKLGRHFRLSAATKLVVGRDEAENERLLTLARPRDILLEMAEMMGPLSLLPPEAENDDILRSAAICAYYSKARAEKRAMVRTRKNGDETCEILAVAPIADEMVESLRVG
jgi:tRNA-uridine 2-sulfurtransferase